MGDGRGVRGRYPCDCGDLRLPSRRSPTTCCANDTVHMTVKCGAWLVLLCQRVSEGEAGAAIRGMSTCSWSRATGWTARSGSVLWPVSYTHLRAHETDSYLVCRLLLEKK